MNLPFKAGRNLTIFCIKERRKCLRTSAGGVVGTFVAILSFATFMQSNIDHFPQKGARVEVILDGLPVMLPPHRCSLAGIRSFLETLAMEQQRVICAFRVDGQMLDPNQALSTQGPFTRVEGETIDLAQIPLRLVRIALQQTAQLRERICSAITVVVINDSRSAREYWWNLARVLKQPLLTLSLMPENAYGSPQGSASLNQLRKWQLEQLGCIIRDVDNTCSLEDSTALSNALEHRVLPWLNALHACLELWHETLCSAPQRPCR